MSEPLGFLITWTTYGTWLPGDQRGWVTEKQPGIQAPNPRRETAAKRKLVSPPLILSGDQRRIVEATIRRHCEIRGWHLHAINVRSNHVHLVVSADVAPETIMEQFKAWCSRRLSEASPHHPNAGPPPKWWTEHGSTKWINDEAYLINAIRYVLERQ